jgi:hypothetical protein
MMVRKNSYQGQKQTRKAMTTYQGQKQTRKAMTTVNGLVLLIGVAGILIFGYLMYQDEVTYSVQNTLSFLATGVGLLISFVLLGLGLFGKMK